MLEIKEVSFLTSVASQTQFVKSDKPIIAVCGKSNVGKSSFINALAKRKNLARVSKEPGRTRLINYFDFGKFILADLPGYGYATVSKEEKLKWARLLESFFADKSNAAHVFALADIRHEPTDGDKQMIEYLYYNALPFTVIATKADKVSKEAARRGALTIAAALKCGRDDIIVTSSENKTGFDLVLARVEQILSVAE